MSAIENQNDAVAGAGDEAAPESPAVVGIGASAGGLKALQVFFEAIPADTGMAFVVVIHLSPKHESSMAELLQSAAVIPVAQVVGRTWMEPNHVYVIPPNRTLEITDGHLALSERAGEGRRAPIDVFFRTLAEKHADAIGILFSGGGADGTVGMKAIKENGGLLMVQQPEEAEHGQMPRSAIATGLVDFVLPVRELAAKLVELRRNGAALALAQSPAALPADEAEMLRRILALLQTRTGHDFSGYKRSTLLRRVVRRMRVTSTESLEDYLGVLRTDAAEAEALQRDFLICVTNFFRDPTAFKALAEEVLVPLLDRTAPSGQLRVWVPGCATGEEAYSIAILLLEAAHRLDVHPGIQIFASDLDDASIAYARDGLYPASIAADVSDERLERFFTREGAFYHVRKDVREMVLFASHSLLKDPPFSKLDLISCRNLLIYLKRELQEKVFELFHYSLAPDGYLFLGSSERATGAGSLFRPIDDARRLYQRQPGPGHPHLPDLPLMRSVPKRMPGGQKTLAATPQQAAADGERHRRALEALAPPSLLADREYDILHLSESAGRYLLIPGGKPTMNAVKVARAELRSDLRAALFDAIENGRASVSRPIALVMDGQHRQVRLHVSPVPSDDGTATALVLFLEADAPDAHEPSPPDALSEARLYQVEQELGATKARLQATVEESDTQQEELKATNEELQSINEEYKSTLEELETSKEELQSINEELKTVNNELKEKVEALSHANDDLQNLMATTEVATLFIDRELRVKRYTPPVATIFNIMPVDTGRPLTHLTHRLQYDGLADDADEVLRSLVPIERAVHSDEGRHYLLRLIPYRTGEERIEGVVITLVDVTRFKAAQEHLRRAQERYRLLIEGVREYAIFMVDLDGAICSWNTGAQHLFGYTEEEALGLPFETIFTEDDRQVGGPEEEMALARAEGRAVDERWHVRANGEHFWGSGILTALYDGAGELQAYAKVLRDNTHRQKAAEELRESQARYKELNEHLEAQVQKRTAALEAAHTRLRSLGSELLRAEQGERHRISQVLHDDLQQRLYGIRMRMAFIRQEAEAGEVESLLANIDAADLWIHEAIQRTRDLTIDLSPPILHGEGLTEALAWLVSQMRERYGLEIELQAEESFHMADAELRVLLFQIVRELVFNVVKHAGVERAFVELKREEGHLVICVRDEGKGFDADQALDGLDRARGFGLFSVRERLHFVGGHMEIESDTDAGTCVTVYAPLDET